MVWLPAYAPGPTPMEKLSEFFLRHLNDGGVLIFTTQGRRSAKWLHENTYNYGLDKGDVANILAAFKKDGFGYAHYPQTSGYGIAIASPSWVLRLVEQTFHLKILSFFEAGWDSHQDVISCIRSFNYHEPLAG